MAKVWLGFRELGAVEIPQRMVKEQELEQHAVDCVVKGYEAQKRAGLVHHALG